MMHCGLLMNIRGLTNVYCLDLTNAPGQTVLK